MKSRLHDCFFSIIIPVFNRERCIERCLESVLAQRDSSFECIIVDNGSSDASHALANAFCEKDSRFRIYKELNQGVSFARNAGIKEARGLYCVLLDSDNTLTDKNTLHDIQEKIRTLPVATAFFCAVSFDDNRLSSLDLPSGSDVSLKNYYAHSQGELAPLVATEWLKKHPFPEQEGIIAEQADLLWVPLISDHRVVALSVPLIRYNTDQTNRVSQRDYVRQDAREMAVYYQALYTKYGASIREQAGLQPWRKLIAKLLLYSRLSGVKPELHDTRLDFLYTLLGLLPKSLVSSLLQWLKNVQKKNEVQAQISGAIPKSGDI